MPDSPTPADKPPAPRPAVVFLVVAACALSLMGLWFALFASRERIVSVASDDAYYYLVVARNLATLGASTFDGLTRTSGYHPLLAALLAGAYALFRPSPDVYVHLLFTLNVLLHLATGAILFVAGRRLRDAATGRIAALLYLCNPYALLWTLSGMEAALNAFSLSLFLLAALSASEARPPRLLLLLAATAALCVWARTDNLLVVGWLSLPLLLPGATPGARLGARAGRVAAVVLAAVAALALWFVFCRWATGDWMQGSARIKMLLRAYNQSDLSAWQSLALALRVGGRFAVKSFVKVPVLKYIAILALLFGTALLKLPRDRRAWMAAFIALPFLLGGAYGMKLTRTATWYYVPAVVSLTLVGAFYARSALGIADRRGGRAACILVAALVALEGLGYAGSKIVRGRNVYQRDMLELADWMRDNLPPDAVVGAWDSGIYSFYSQRRVINLDGLMNNEIAPLMEANRPLWPDWKARGIDSVKNYELWYAGVPDQIWRYWRDRRIEYLAGSTRWLRNIPPEWQGAERIVLREPKALHSSSPKALYRIRWPDANPPEAAP